jgi:Spx/MgsR family transcriptional regulator
MYIVYGIPNCDTIKKTLQWLQSHEIPYSFHDYKKQGISAAKLRSWCKQAGWEMILNKKSTTWRELDAKVQASITTEVKAIELMTLFTSSIKRPVIEKDGKLVTVGFNEKNYTALF